MRLRPLTLTAAGGLAAVILGACGSGSKRLKSGHDVAVRLTDAGCEPAKFAIPAGPVNFKITNAGTSRVTEAELLQGTKILGEKENLSDGLSGSFSLRLKAGTYTLACPNGKTSAKAPVVVTGRAAAASGDGPQLAAATSAYARYVRAQAATLVTRTQAFAAAVTAGNVAAARRLYGPSLPSPATSSTRITRAAISASRPARTTRRSRSTRSAT